MDDDLEVLVSEYRTELDAIMNKVIGETGIMLTKGKPESTLGNFMADLLLEKANEVTQGGVDLAYQNNGGIRVTEIPKGDITVGKIFELMPFDNLLFVVDCPGDILAQWVDSLSLSSGGPLGGDFSWRIENHQTKEFVINGKPIDKNATYKIAMPDYSARAGRLSNLFEGLPMMDTGILIRDAILEYVEKSKGPISPKLDGRITVLKK